MESEKVVAESQEGADAGNALPLNFRLVYDFATTAPLDEIRFILETRDYNMNAAREAIKGNYGHNLGKTIDRPLAKGIFGHTIFSHIISRTAAACDARMGGAMIPVMSNSGSGNQGICATNPVCVYAKENENTEEELIRALTLSHLTAHRHLYQTVTGHALGTMRMRGSLYRQQCGYHLPDGRRLRALLSQCEEHDCQPDGYDL